MNRLKVGALLSYVIAGLCFLIKFVYMLIELSCIAGEGFCRISLSTHPETKWHSVNNTRSKL